MSQIVLKHKQEYACIFAGNGSFDDYWSFIFEIMSQKDLYKIDFKEVDSVWKQLKKHNISFLTKDFRLK